jgi:uncharacterized protein YciI
VVIYHAAITTAPNYQERRVPHRQAHLERIVGLRTQGSVIGGGPSPDGQSVELFYRVAQPSAVTRLIEEDPYWEGKAWERYALRSFSQFVEPWELPPLVTDGSRVASIIEGPAEDPDLATFALIELRGASRLAFGGFLDNGTTLALLPTGDTNEALGWLADTGFWKLERLSARPLLWVL